MLPKRVVTSVLGLASLAGCGGGTDTPTPNAQTVWREAFDTSQAGALSAVWGSSSSDVYVVGGVPDRGEVYRFDGREWRALDIPEVPLLVWVYGFGPEDIYAVGVGGGALHYDGMGWTPLDTDVSADLWGIWGPASDDQWVVGADTEVGVAVILRFDGQRFETVTVPENDRGATQLFKVWGIGDSVFAVGELGLILQYINDEWVQVFGGPDADDDFVALWGTSEDHIVAVGGRATARISVYDGDTWNTRRLSGIPGLNAVFTVERDQVIVGGANGFLGVFRPSTGELVAEDTETTLDLHAAWGQSDGDFFGVGGQFREPFQGVALIRDFR